MCGYAAQDSLHIFQSHPFLHLVFFTGPAAMQPKSGVYLVGDFMTRKEDLHVVKPTTTVDEGICKIYSMY